MLDAMQSMSGLMDTSLDGRVRREDGIFAPMIKDGVRGKGGCRRGRGGSMLLWLPEDRRTLSLGGAQQLLLHQT
jgi:hypothetical protein